MAISLDLTNALADLRAAATEYATARGTELALEHDRPVVKQDAIARIMQTTNPLTNRPHSCSSAEAVVETDREYAQYLADQRRAVMETMLAKARYEAARYVCEAVARSATLRDWVGAAGPQDLTPGEPRLF